jgi:hypothetical protein
MLSDEFLGLFPEAFGLGLILPISVGLYPFCQILADVPSRDRAQDGRKQRPHDLKGGRHEDDLKNPSAYFLHEIALLPAVEYSIRQVVPQVEKPESTGMGSYPGFKTTSSASPRAHQSCSMPSGVR